MYQTRAKVFVSYARDDGDYVNENIRDILQQAGLDVWIDVSGIGAGEAYRNSIKNGMREADCFVIVMSPRSAASNDVKGELDWAIRHMRKIVPVLIEDCDIELFDYSVSGIHWLDFRESSAAAKQQLVDRVQALVPHAEQRPFSIRDERLAKQLNVRATQQIADDLADEAMTTLNEALAIEPDSEQTHYLLGLACLLQSDNLDASHAHLSTAVQVNPQHAPSHHLLAAMYRTLDATIPAIQHIRKAMSSFPTNGFYRDLHRDLLSKCPESPPEDANSVDINISIDAASLDKLRHLGKAAFHNDRLQTMFLRHWTETIPPLSIIMRCRLGPVGTTLQAFLGTALYAAIGFCTVMFLNIGGDPNRHIFSEQLVIWTVIWLCTFAPILGTRFIARTYERLRGIVDMTEQPLSEQRFRHFFLRQCPYLTGIHPGAEEKTSKRAERPRLRDNLLHVFPGLILLLFLSPLQYVCARDTWVWDPAVLSRYAAYWLELYSLIWAPGLALLSLKFIPAFTSLPLRYFLGMPEGVSLKPIGGLYLRLSLLGAVLYVLALCQFFVFRTYSFAPTITVTYCAILLVLLSSPMLASQLLLRQCLNKLKDARLLEYSYKLESAFQAAIRSPNTPTIEHLRNLHQFLDDIHKLDTSSLSRFDKLLLVTAVLLVSASTALFLVFART